MNFSCEVKYHGHRRGLMNVLRSVYSVNTDMACPVSQSFLTLGNSFLHKGYLELK